MARSSTRGTSTRARLRTPRPWLTVLVGLGLIAMLALLWFQQQGVFLRQGGEDTAPPKDSHPAQTRRSTEGFRFPTPPEGYMTLVLPAPPRSVYDGDTFEADLDGDGKLETPRERVRLLYVDTPELGESWKGADKEHGIPARDFLAAWLADGPVRLLVSRTSPTGIYGRTLALVETPKGLANLALVREGHSPFDTRFGVPVDYVRWRQAEGEAFDVERGIWGDPVSKAAYLERLKDKHLATPAAKTNSAYRAALYQASAFEPATLMETYIHLEGRLTRIDKRSKGVRILNMERGRGKKPFPAVVFGKRAEWLGVATWKPGQIVQVEGFIDTYRNNPQMRVHYGKRIQ